MSGASSLEALQNMNVKFQKIVFLLLLWVFALPVFATGIQRYGVITQVAPFGTSTITYPGFIGSGSGSVKVQGGVWPTNVSPNCGAVATSTFAVSGYLLASYSGFGPCLTVPLSSGTGTLPYFLLLGTSGGNSNNDYIQFTYDENTGLFSTVSDPSLSTSILTVNPSGGSVVATSTSFTFGATGNVLSTDFVSGTYISISYSLKNSPFLGNVGVGITDAFNQFSSSGSFFLPLSSSGLYSVSTTTSLIQQGIYTLTVSIHSPNTGFFGSFFDIFSGDRILISTSTTFTAAAISQGDAIASSTSIDIASLLVGASSTASTLNVLCNPFSGSFSVAQCAASLFVPDPVYLNQSLTAFKNSTVTHFPIGYVSDFLTIISASSSTSTLPIIDATVPSGVVGTGSHIHLSLDHVLDFILYATTTDKFNSQGATSTQTFYQITSYYWQILINVLVLLYLLRRILGSHLIPHPGGFGEKGSLSDTSSSDDSYALKEYLYKNRKK